MPDIPVQAEIGATRVVRIDVPWPLKLIQPILVRAFRAESGRTLAALKVCADTLG